MKKSTWINLAFQSGAVVVALLITTLLLVTSGAPPFKPYLNILKGAFGSAQNIFAVLIAWSPLLLTTAGLLITFSAGLWNIGMEGQIMAGAIFTAGILRMLQGTNLPPAFIILMGILAGVI